MPQTIDWKQLKEAAKECLRVQSSSGYGSGLYASRKFRALCSPEIVLDLIERARRNNDD